MLDEQGEAITPIEPGRTGQIRAHGEIWNATSDRPIAAGQQVRIVAVRGLLVTVRPDGTAAVQEAS
jgi:membrane-bound serine protease (ClpP class)